MAPQQLSGRFPPADNAADSHGDAALLFLIARTVSDTCDPVGSSRWICAIAFGS